MDLVERAGAEQQRGEGVQNAGPHALPGVGTEPHGNAGGLRGSGFKCRQVAATWGMRR